ncbi:MAG: hypothetical protein SNJ33_00535 [Rikenellaceae bacterium]
MKIFRATLLLLVLGVTMEVVAEDDATSSLRYGVERHSSEYFQTRYQYNDLVHYLDNMSLHVTYQAETTGEYNQADQLIFSVEGNSYKWNKYYLDGFRVDSRFFAGSTLFKSDMYNYDLGIDYLSSKLYFDSSQSFKASSSVSYNFGGVGGISPGADEFVNLFHLTATQRMYQPVDERSKIQGAAKATVNFFTKGENRPLRQSIYFDFGVRDQVFFDQTGINTYIPEQYANVQANGELSATMGSLFDNTNYILNYKYRDNLYSELGYNLAETSRLNSYSASFYGVKSNENIKYSSGLTLAVNHTEHDDINFERNVIDLDGEAYDPWYTDGANYELSHALNLSYKINDWLTLRADTYNSFLYNAPSVNDFSNIIYAQDVEQESRDMLYLYEWHADSYASGLLENSVGFVAERKLSKSVDFMASLDFTLDGMLLSGESMVTPNFEAQMSFSINPCKWFDMEFTLAKKRVSYNIDDVRYFSDSYMNADIYYVDSAGNKGNYYTSTGGEYRTAASGLKQTSYILVDIPINLTFGRHKISLLHSYRKYYNTWTTSYSESLNDVGYYQSAINDRTGESVELFYLNPGKAVEYTVSHYPDGIMGDNFFTKSPYMLSSNIQYQYQSDKVLFSLGWQSYMVAGISSLGNGAISNNINSLSESSANPNTYQVVDNLDSDYRSAGRLDQDRAYVLRMFLSYNATKNLSFALNAKFKDGQAFSSLSSEVIQTSQGDNQVAIYPTTSRGINTIDGNFGCREDAFFNVDLSATYRWEMFQHNFSLQARVYNIYDFGTELTEYTYEDTLILDDGVGRRAMSLNIPRGFIFTLSIDL